MAREGLVAFEVFTVRVQPSLKVKRVSNDEGPGR